MRALFTTMLTFASAEQALLGGDGHDFFPAAMQKIKDLASAIPVTKAEARSKHPF